MKWTFGVITDGKNDALLRQSIDSVLSLGIPYDCFEIIVVGNTSLRPRKTKVIQFDESIRPNWITKKKNIIAQEASFDNIVLFHDYLYFVRGWYEAYRDFIPDWDVCMNPIHDPKGNRFRDWVTWNPRTWVPYDNDKHIRSMYVSGSYFCVKKKFLLANPLDERLGWAEGEDVEWSERLCSKWNYKCNSKALVRLMKDKLTHMQGHLVELGNDRILGILYDLDGVLVDACDWHYYALNQALLEVAGCTIERQDHETTFNGLPTKAKLSILLDRGAIRSDMLEKIEKLKQEYTTNVINEFASRDQEKIGLHEYCRHLGLRIGCVTNSIRKTASLMLLNTGQLQYLDILISNEDASPNKPSPHPYNVAMAQLGLRPENVLIVEDSDKGIESALGTGAHVMRVKNATEVTCSSMFDSKSSSVSIARIIA